MKRKPFVIKTLTDESLGKLDTSLDILYKHKIESIKFQDCGVNKITSFQETEHGYTKYTDTIVSGTSSTNTTIAFATTYNTVMGIFLQPIGSSFTVNVMSYTGSSMLVQIDVTAAIDNGTYPFFWKVVGSME